MTDIERGTSEVAETEIAPIQPITKDGVRLIAGMFKGALIKSRNSYRTANDRSMRGVTDKENRGLYASAEINGSRAEDIATVLTLLGQESLVSNIRKNINK